MNPMEKLDLALSLLKSVESDSIQGNAVAYASLSGYLMAYATDDQADKILKIVSEKVGK